ncbi:MAG TPA: hypothetical protein VEG29_08265 [Candidatus Binatia bacterium]|nr:hypothetical protein [Candidatus Binatia bacterium]
MPDPTPTGGTQPGDTARDPNLNRPADDTVRGAQEQDDSTKATAGVKFPGGTKVEVTTDGTQSGGIQFTIPLDPSPSKPVDTTPSAVNPDAPAPAGECTGADGQTYPDGWTIFKDMVPISKCVNGTWVPVTPDPVAPPLEMSPPGDYPSPDPNATTMVASNDPYGSSSSDPYASSGVGDPYGSSSGDPNDPYA